LAAAGCGGGKATPASASGATATPSLSLTGVRVIPRVALPAGHATRVALPAGGAVVSFDVARGRPKAELDVGVGGRMLVVGGTFPLRAHLEIAGHRAAVNGRVFATGLPTAGQVTFQPARGTPQVSALIISPASEPAALLLHRLAELHARLAPGQFPIGASANDVLHNSQTYWTSGFWPGALWQAAALEPAGGMFARWALAATLAHLGHERQDTHDVGFMYEQSSLAAYLALCQKGRHPVALCSRLRRSVLSAADELMALAASNSRAGTIPTNSFGPDADTIVDSMMNVAILPWATRRSGDPAYSRVARRHAERIAGLLIRPNGSTIQAVNFDRATGRVTSFATHQGISEKSTWSRGEGWALYGFAVAASELRDRGLLRVAERVAGYVRSHLPASRVPLWDYDARSGPVDVSAGVITAAGLLHLAAACRQLEGSCPAARSWVALSRHMLAGALGYASARPPLGLLRGQVLNERAGGWADGGELSFGLSYALEALRLEQHS
jgi:unsaturated chondroitin disaccharide hydrolase